MAKKDRKVKFTKEGFQKLKKELDELVEIKRPQIIKKLQKARDMGDLSENSAYSSAKEELAFIDSRINEIKEKIEKAEIVEKNISRGIIDIGSSVVVETNGEKLTFTIVGELEGDISKGKLSENSPIGSALIGRKKGDKVEVKIPAGKVVYKILDVK